MWEATKVRAADRAAAGYGPVQLIGTVMVAGEDGGYDVRCDGESWRVRRAASCLLAPAPGDTVLICGPSPERVYLVAVIELAHDEPLRILAEGDMVIASRTGSVRVQAADSLELHGKRRLDLDSNEFALRAGKADCRVSDLQYVGKNVNAVVTACRLVGHVWEVVADRLTHMARSAFRLVEETEQVRAGALDYQADRTARIHAQHTVVTATDLVKVDAKQIHMG